MMKINEEITLENVIGKVATLMVSDYRFVTMTAVDCDEYFDIYYHFDRNYELYNLKLELAKDANLPSITKVCPCAFVIENEIQDLFGITMTDLELDFEKHFILNEDAPEKPFCRVPGVSVSTVEVKGEQK